MRFRIAQFAILSTRWLRVVLYQIFLPTPNIIFQIEPSALHRYIYNLHRLAKDADVTMGIELTTFNKKLLLSLTNPYAFKALCQIPLVVRHRCEAIRMSSDYFTAEYNTYRIPIGTHPTFPTDISLSIPKKTNAVTFAGSVSPAYRTFPSKLWQMPSRHQTIEVLRAKFPDVVKARMNPNEYINHLLNTRYFLCLPGLSMPLCHNLFESLACGCIPIMHKSYAQLLEPEFQQIISATIYQNDDELINIIARIYSGDKNINEQKVCDELMIYFEHYNSWDSIAAAIHNGKSLLICAEEHSVQMALERTSSRKGSN